MKNLKKFVALLLAGVMAMVLLTACGGGGNGSNLKDVPDAEAKVMSQIHDKGTSAASLKNDDDLRRTAEKWLEHDLKGSFEFLGYKFNGDVHVEGQDQKELTVTVTANYLFEGTLLNALLKQIETNTNVSTGIKANINQSSNWTKVGVVVKTDNKQSFVAISFKIANPNYVK